MFQTLIPEDYVYKINHIEMLENNYFRAKFEIADCTEDMFLIWLSKLEKKSKVTYRVKSFTRSTSTKIVFNVNKKKSNKIHLLIIIIYSHLQYK